MPKDNKPLNYTAIGLGILFVACLGVCGACIPWGGLALKEEPFHGPASSGDWVTMKRLLDQGLPVDAEDQNGNTALYYAASHNQIDFTQKLVDRGADVFHRNHWNRGALEIDNVITNRKTLEWAHRTLERASSKRP